MGVEAGAPSQVKRDRDMRSDLRINRDARFKARRVKRVDEEGNEYEVLRIEGYASITDTAYELASWWGSFEETVARGAFKKTLAAGPKVILRANHIDLPLAATRSGTLELREDQTGLWFGADMDARRTDALDLFLGIDRGDIDECSFAGWIVEYTENTETMDWTLNEIDIDRGDVAVVSFGANPYTSVGVARSQAPVNRARQRFDRSFHQVLENSG